MLPDFQSLAGQDGYQGPPDTNGTQDGDPVSILEQMLQLADQYRGVEPDQEDKATMEQARTLLQNLLAKDQKDRDGLLSGKTSPAAMRRVLGG